MKRVVIVGAGFVELATATEMMHSDAEAFVVDRANYNLFQPLLYKVATTELFSGSNRASDPWTSEKSEK